MKRFAFALLLACASLCAPAATVTLVPASSSVGLGSIFDLTLQVDNLADGRPDGDEFLAFGFNVSIADPSLVTFLSAAVDPAFVDLSPFFAGQPMVAALAFPGIPVSGVSGPLTLAVLTFQAGGAMGSTSISVSGNPLADPNEGLLFVSAAENLDARASVQLVPEPATLALSAAGLAILLAFRRRRALQ